MSKMLAHNVACAIQRVMEAAFPELMHEKKATEQNVTTKRMAKKEGTSKFTAPVDELAAYLARAIGTAESMQQLDIPVLFTDWKHFQGSKPAEPTTYASWLRYGLYGLYTSLQADHRVRDKWVRPPLRCPW